MNPTPRQLWQVAGTLALAHVVLIPICLALSMPALFTDGTDGISESYAEGDMTRTFIGGVLEASRSCCSCRRWCSSAARSAGAARAAGRRRPACCAGWATSR